MADGAIVQLNAMMKEPFIVSQLAQVETSQRRNRLIQHLRLLRQRREARDQIMPHIQIVARIDTLREIDVGKFRKHLATHRGARSHELRHDPWLLRVRRRALHNLKLPRALGRTTTGSTTTSTSTIGCTTTSAGISGSFGLCSDLMNEESVPVVAQTLYPRLQAPCALGFLLIALLSQSVLRGCHVTARKKKAAHLDLPLPTRPATLALPRNATHLRSYTSFVPVVSRGLSSRYQIQPGLEQTGIL